MAKLTVYQTTHNKGNHEDIEKAGGIYGDKTDLFLGKGYYYWEDDFDKAKEWGNNHYGGNAYIFCGIFDFDLEKMFDMSLNMHLNYIQKLQKQLHSKTKKCGALKIGAFIDFLLEYQAELLKNNEITEDDLFFPFYYSKGLDGTFFDRYAPTDTFSLKSGHYYYLKPPVFFCVYKKEYLNLSSFRLVKTLGTKQI